VAQARSQPGGFSPGVAARALCEDGTRCFIKAVSAEANPDTPAMHRREARILRALDPLISAGLLPAPRLWGTIDLGCWTALVLDDVDGRQPGVPWAPDDLATVLTTLDLLADARTPAPVEVPGIEEAHGEEFTGWRSLAAGSGAGRLDAWSRQRLDLLAVLEPDWAAHARGDTLVHADIRADNLLLTGDRVMVVDWPHACLGAPFIDVVLFAPSVAMQGGPPPAELLARTRVGREVDRDALIPVVCALAGFFTERSLRPSPPGLPTLRAFQAAQSSITRDWLADLLRARG